MVLLQIGNEIYLKYSAAILVPGSMSLYQYHPEHLLPVCFYSLVLISQSSGTCSENTTDLSSCGLQGRACLLNYNGPLTLWLGVYSIYLKKRQCCHLLRTAPRPKISASSFRQSVRYCANALNVVRMRLNKHAWAL